MSNYYDQDAYDRLLQDLERNNVQLSPAQMDIIAKQNPYDAYAIMNAKLDYANAKTPEGQALAHSNAEQINARYGFSGGEDGSQYIPLPGFQSSFTYPTMSNQYQDIYDQKLQAVYDRKPFEYDPSTDPLYGYYKDAYNREGQRAMQQTLAEVSARTGGLASSYATTAAAQQQNYYAQQLADKIPDLYQMAYQQYADKFNRSLQDASLAGDRYNMELGRYNTDRNFAYQLYGDDWTRRQTAINDARDRVMTMIEQGADISSIPRELLLASGYTDAEIQQAITYRELLQAGRGGGGGYRAPDDDDEPPISDEMQDARNQIMTILKYGGTFENIPKRVLQASGWSKGEILNMAGGTNTSNADTGTGNPYTPAPSSINQSLVTDISGNIKNFNDASNYLKNHGVTATPLTQDQWAGSSSKTVFDTYQDYLQAFVYEHMSNRSGATR